MTHVNILFPPLLLLALLLPTTLNAQSDKEPLGLKEGASVSALAVSLKDGKILAEYDSQRRLTPASVSKAFTTGAALRILGSDAHFTTRFGLSSDKQTLTVHGTFDPTVGSQYFLDNGMDKVADSLSTHLKSMGVKDIEQLTIDMSLQPVSEYSGCRLWEDMGSFFGATPSVVMDRDNELSLYFNTPMGVGKECRLDSVVPDICGKWPRTSVMTYAGNSDHCLVYMLDTTYWLAAGRIPQGRNAFRVKVAAPTPEMNYAKHLTMLLGKRGINISHINLNVQPTTDSTIYTHLSPTLAEITKQTNTHSVNHFADAIALHLSTDGGTRRASWDNAADAVANFWAKQGVDVTLRDGSGLATQNEVSASNVVAMLKNMKKSSVGSAYKQTLPRMGCEGTWAHMGHKTPLKGKVWAKSGTMTGVVAYAGYMNLRNGDEVAFCVIVNHNKEKSAEVRQKIVNWLLHIYNTSGI